MPRAARVFQMASTTRTVLVCIGERKRPVVISHDQNEKRKWFDVIKVAFADVLEEKPIRKPVIQLKSEEWHGQFLDFQGDSLPDRAVVRVIDEDDSKILSSKALSISQRLSKPSLGEAKALGNLFPSSNSHSGKRGRAFDPTADECISVEKKKKKAAVSQGRPTNVKIMMLKSFSPFIPRGRPRALLKQEGREIMLQFRRSMSPQEVRNTIIRGFSKAHGLDNWTYLACDSDNHLFISKNQELDGNDVINRKGCLYICPKKAVQSKTQGKANVSAADDQQRRDPPVIITNHQRAHPPVVIGSSSDSSDDELPSIGILNGSSNDKGPSITDVSQPIEHQGSSNDKGPSTTDISQPTDHQDQSGSNQNEELRHRRELVAQQNQDFADSLNIDREKAANERRAKEKREILYALKEQLREKFAQPQVPSNSTSSRKISFRFPDSTKSFDFSDSSPTKELYEFVFSVNDNEDAFTLYKMFPREAIELGGTLQSCGIEGVLSITYEESSPDPCDYLQVSEMMAMDPQVDEESSVTRDISILEKAESRRTKFMLSLKLKRGISHMVDRATIFDSVIKLYTSELPQILQEYPFRIKYRDEKAVDVGGVSRDMFSAFFEEAYTKLFDGGSLLAPAVLPHIDMSVWPVMGAIISHAYLASGILPIRIAFPCISAILLPPGGQLPQNVLVETFVDCLSRHDASIFKDAFEEAKAGKKFFSSTIQSNAVSILCRFGCREMPNPSNLTRLISQVATFQFVMQPAMAIAGMKSGIPENLVPFWNSLSMGDLYLVYKALHASPSKVLEMLIEPVFANASQQRVYGFLCDFIGDMKQDEIRSFLRFVTGSAVYLAKSIQITFNNLTGLGRRPVSHTCSCTLELPISYITKYEFVSEFQEVLRESDNVFAWMMDAI